MSTSSRPKLETRSDAPILPFAYHEAMRSLTTDMPSAGSSVASAAVIETARLQGREEGETRGREVFSAELTKIRESLRAALTDFAGERAVYFHQVEGEIVQLALNIARHILHREAQVDPLLLAGLAHVALKKIEKATDVVVRVHPQNAADWKSYFAQQMNAPDVPSLIEDPALEPDRCVVQTSLGTTELGLELQFKEVERGFMDLLAKRPRP